MPKPNYAIRFAGVLGGGVAALLVDVALQAPAWAYAWTAVVILGMLALARFTP